jgi:hypothetical protein
LGLGRGQEDFFSRFVLGADQPAAAVLSGPPMRSSALAAACPWYGSYPSYPHPLLIFCGEVRVCLNFIPWFWGAVYFPQKASLCFPCKLQNTRALIFKTSYELLLCIQYNAEASEILFHINPNEHGTKFLFSSEIGCKLATRLSLIDSLVAAHLGILPLLYKP